MSKLATLLGIILALIVLSMSMVDFNNWEFNYAFLNWQGLLVVLGGTFAAILINYPLNQVKCAFAGFAKVLFHEPRNHSQIIDEIVRLSHIAKQKGLLGIEKEIEELDDAFLRFSLTEMLVYQDAEDLKQSLHNRLINMRLRHISCQELFANMAAYAPAFGMLGTVMGLIIMMTNQVSNGFAPAAVDETQDMLAVLLHGMGLALVTTFYGVLFANLVFMPMSGKLKVLSEAETLRNEMIIQGVVDLKNTQPTLLIREKLLVYLNEKTQLKLEAAQG